jgi:cytochrome b561
MPQVSRHHPLLVGLHWFLAFLIIAALTLGFFGLAPMANSNPQKIEGLRAHMSGGILILTLMSVRLLIRMTTSRPAAATTGVSVLDRIAVVTHYGFYVLIFAMAGTGLATAVLADLPAIVFGGSGAPLPSSFLIYPTRVAHGIIAGALVGVIALHILAALYHQFIKGDGLLGRMWFGRRLLAVSTDDHKQQPLGT